MPKFDPNQPRGLVTFQCRDCRNTFERDPERTEDAPEREAHPFRYFAHCRLCGGEVEQAAWEQALLKAWQSATGPRTPEGKAASAANLDGHPTPEESRRTRFNAMKHGLHARTATFFPARPDGYAHCAGCEVDRIWCAQQPACVKKTEIFMLHHAAFEQRDPKHLMGVYSELQAAVFAVLQQIIQTIIADGVKITSPQYYTDKDGVMILAEYFDHEAGKNVRIMDIQAHPLFKPLGELISRTGLSLTDMGMTVKVQEADEEQFGRLQQEHQQREQLTDYQQRQVKALEGLRDMVERANRRTEQDPVLLEYNRETGEAVAHPLEPS